MNTTESNPPSFPMPPMPLIEALADELDAEAGLTPPPAPTYVCRVCDNNGQPEGCGICGRYI